MIQTQEIPDLRFYISPNQWAFFFFYDKKTWLALFFQYMAYVGSVASTLKFCVDI